MALPSARKGVQEPAAMTQTRGVQTRKLVLAAFITGLAILVAGAIFALSLIK